ncbi:FAD binding domain protein [Microdochium trichocladiopsis]|uniref:FAD binding domain protein n=1 Tax=Microdochium trichocladiopsis TaxID=1682393 RepID=A0A9P8XUQ0_9PEZI|nr:FAD binding domain protein [Microdochium trichocladiopsis]KAH7014098.1 FAD binding domain protein [Microdochium trichocladiopsis]
MAVPKPPFRVIIAGGGIAGLTLANMFEKFDIDYVILEAYKDIAPPVGASIALKPNGLLILDQIGCYDGVAKVAHSSADGEAWVRDPNGKPISMQRLLYQHVGKRHGYNMLFFDRQWLLKVLYDHLRSKDKVFVNQKVQTITTGPLGVEVKTACGDIFSGSMVIGADGIHSAVRQEMRRLADEHSPAGFRPDEEDNVPCYYQCSFGIAQNVEKWKDGEQTHTCGHGKAFLVAPGPGGRVYWFLFIKLPRVMHGKDIPKFTKQDEEKLVAENRNLLVKENLTFGEIFDQRVSSTLTSLHEVVYEKWFYDRMMLIGDSAHKPNPIGGMGGNGAIESAAELVNHLLDVRSERQGSLDGISTAELQDIFQQVQHARFSRASEVVEQAHELQALFSYERPFFSQAVLRIGALLGAKDATLARIGGLVVGGTRLKHAPIPRRPRVIPFDYELPAAPLGAKSHMAVRVVFTLVMIALLFTTEGLNRTVPWAGLFPASQHLLANSKAQASFFAIQLISPLLVWVIEAHRVGNQASLLSLASLFALATPFLGISRAVPLYAIALTTSPLINAALREIEPKAVKSILPALVLAYVIPSIVIIVQAGGVEECTTLWRFAPALFSLSTTIIWKAATLLSRNRGGAIQLSDGENDKELDRYKDLELPFLNITYFIAFIALTATHILALFCANVSHVDIATTAIEVIVDQFAKVNLMSALPAVILLELYSVYEMRRLGQITTITAVLAAGFVLLAQILVGPGAAWIGLWFWRENTVARLSTLNDKQ